MFFYTFMPKLFNMSLTASVAIVLVILLRLLLKKAPKVISYALWGVVLFRLLCPVSIDSIFSVYNLFDTPVQGSGTITSVIEYVPSDIVHTEHPSVTLPVPGISDAINEVLPQGREQLVADPLETPMSIATYVWMIGVMGMIIYSIVSYIRLRRKLFVVVPLRDNIFIADDIKSPFVIGLFRPKIYLPCNLGDKEQEYIILHEQHHIKRLDHVMKALAFGALAIHWFNPLVWIAFILASKDMEMSCDEAVIRKIGGDVRADYSASLLTLATGRRIIAGTPLAFGEGDTKGRINNLSKWKKPTVWAVLLAVVTCAILAISLLTNPSAKREFPINGNNVSELDTHDAILEIINPTDDHNFAYDTAVEKIYEDDTNEYFIDGLDSEHIIVRYADGTQEDIVAALNSGRACMADLDKFGIAYWAEPKGDELYSAVLNAIRDRNQSDKTDGLLHCSSFVLLKQEELSGTPLVGSANHTKIVIAYGIALHEAYGFSGHTFHGVEGSHIPTVITFEEIDGEYILKDYWTPRDGSYYAADVKDKFPDDVEDEALNTQKYVLAQKQECYDQAVRYGNVDTDYAVGYLFDVIESSPTTSSRPADYIDAHPSEYEELTYYGSYTLRYIFSQFLEGNQTGLRGHLMRAVLDDIAPEAQMKLNAETGQEYFDEWKAGAIRVSKQHDMDWIKANQPAIWLLLQMIDE